MAERITCGDSDMRHSITGKGQQNNSDMSLTGINHRILDTNTK